MASLPSIFGSAYSLSPGLTILSLIVVKSDSSDVPAVDGSL